MKKIIVLFILLLSLSYSIKGQSGGSGGTAGAQQLLIPVGARSMGMNGAFISGIDGIEAIYYNPAGIIHSSGSIDAMFSYMNFIADVGLSYAAVSSNLGEIGAVGLSLKSLDVGDIPITTTQEAYGTGMFFSPTLIVAGLSYANFLSDNISIGTNVNVIFERILETSATGVAFDFGVQYRNLADVNGLKAGVVLRNIGPMMKYDGPDLLRVVSEESDSRGNQLYKVDAAGFELPAMFEIGVSYEQRIADSYSFLFASSYLSSSYFEDEIKLAGEFNYDNLFFVRGGYALSPAEDKYDARVFGPTFGAGVHLHTVFNVTVDYAYRVARFFNSNHIFSVKISF